MTPTALHAIGTPAPAAAPTASGHATSLTYEPYYGLQEKAFSLSADPRFLYKSRSHALAFTELTTAIRRREGLVVLTGEIGTGKTTLCRAVLQDLDRRTFSAFVADPFLSREDLLKILLVEFGVVSVEDLKAGHLQGSTRQDLSYRLYDFLNSLVPLQAFAVVVVDEAQNLSLPLLEEIRILNDLEWQEKLVQVVLVGQPELRSRLKLPQLRQVEQRVSMRCELTALGRTDAASYVDHRLTIARGAASTVRFSPDALNVVHHASAGVPRLINLICDRALYEAHRLGATRRIESAIVWKALGALGLDVTPVKAPEEPGTGLIEIGEPVVSVRIETESVQLEGPKPDPGGLTKVVEADLQVRLISGDQPVVTPASALVVDEPAPIPTPVVVPVLEGDSIAAFQSEADGDVGAADAEERVRAPKRSIRFALTAAAVVLMLGGVPATTWYGDDAAGILIGDLIVPPLPQAPPMIAAVGTTENTIDEAAVTAPAGSSDAVAAAPATVATAGMHEVEVALFGSRERAARSIEELAAGGHAAYTVELRLGTRQFVRVLAGPFATSDDAENALAAISQMPGYEDARIAMKSTR